MLLLSQENVVVDQAKPVLCRLMRAELQAAGQSPSGAHNTLVARLISNRRVAPPLRWSLRHSAPHSGRGYGAGTGSPRPASSSSCTRSASSTRCRTLPRHFLDTS